jgi:hypothetical protein
MELGREFVRDRVRKLLGDTSDFDTIAGEHAGFPVELRYSDQRCDPPETTIKAELPNHYDFNLHLEQRTRTPRDTVTIHTFSGTATPPDVPRFLFDRRLCDLLAEQKVSHVRIALFDPKESLSRGTVRILEALEEQDGWRSKYSVTLTVRGWIEDPERAIAAIALVVELASRIGDAVTRAAGAELATGPYRDAPTERSAKSVDRNSVHRIVAAGYSLLSRMVAGWWPF